YRIAVAGADVAHVVHGHAAHVHARFARHQRGEILIAAVEDPQRHQVASTLTTAIAAIPSSRPSRPRCSGLLAFTLTRSGSRPRASARRLAISGRNGPRRGDWQITVASTLTRRPPPAVTTSITDRSNTTLEAPA